MHPLVVLFLILVVSGLVLVGASRANAGDGRVSKQGATASSFGDRVRGWFCDRPYGASTDGGTGRFTRAELTLRLQGLAASTPPTKDQLQMGAMCYKTAMPTGTFDVTCSHCAEKTVFKNDWELRQFETCQRLAQGIRNHARGLDVQLDTRYLCHACNPALAALAGDGPFDVPSTGTVKNADGDDVSTLHLIIVFEDGTKRRSPVNVQGLRALSSFVSGSDRIAGDTGNESPLKDQLPRLQAILGLAP